MIKVLHLTGQGTSEKLGGLERWYCALADLLQKNCKIILAFEDKMPTPLIMKHFDDHGIEVIILNATDLPLFPHFIKTNDINVVHCHFENLLSFLPVAKKYGCKTFWTVHMDLYYHTHLEWKKSVKLRIGVEYYKFKIRQIIKYLDHIYFVSDLLVKTYSEFFNIKKSKTSVNYLGITKDLLHSERESTLLKTDNIVVITCIAFLDKIKGIDIIIKAVEILKERNLAFHVNIIGGCLDWGNVERTEFYKTAQDREFLNLITFVGVTHNIGKYLSSTDIYIQPSRSEALPFAIMEAMCYSLPIVATNVGGVPELVYDELNGFLCKREDAGDLAGKIEKLMKDKKLRQIMGEQSFSLINSKKFSQYENQLIIQTNYKK